MQEDLEVTGISRSGRVRKKSSKLMDFESPDDIETKFRRQTPVKTYGTSFRAEEPQDFTAQEPTPQRMDDAGTASGSESDFYENPENPDSMESDSSASDEGSARTPANSLYMMEKSSKKKLIVKDGRVIGRAKAQRKDKGKTRITAYMMWAKEARNELLRKHPDMDFSAISKRLGEMWSNVNYNERYLWKRKAKRFAIQKEQNNPPASRIISNPDKTRPVNAECLPHSPKTPGEADTLFPKGPVKVISKKPKRPVFAKVSECVIRPVHPGPGRPPVNRAPPKQTATPVTSPQQALVPVSATVSASSSSGSAQSGMYRVTGCGAVDVAAHLRLLGESLAIIGARLKEHEGQIAVSGSVSVLLDTLLCSLAPLLSVTRALPAIAPPASLLQDTLHNIAYIMPGL